LAAPVVAVGEGDPTERGEAPVRAMARP